MALSRSQMEQHLTHMYLRKHVSFITVRNEEITGMVNRITYETALGEPMVIAHIGKHRIEVDLEYFNENIEIL